MALNPNVPVVAPLDLITAAHMNAVRSNLIGLEERFPKLFAVSGTGGGPTAWTTELSTCGLTIPVQPVAGTVLVTAMMRVDKTVPADGFTVRVRRDTAITGPIVAQQPLVGLAFDFSTLIASTTQAAGASLSMWLSLQRTSGTGNATVYADGTAHRITAVWFPA